MVRVGVDTAEPMASTYSEVTDTHPRTPVPLSTHLRTQPLKRGFGFLGLWRIGLDLRAARLGGQCFDDQHVFVGADRPPRRVQGWHFDDARLCSRWVEG